MTMTNPKNPGPELEAFAGIDAKPLVMQSLLDKIKPKSPEIVFYWGNRVAGDGLRLNQHMAVGWEAAKVEDCKIPPPTSMVRDGRIMYGDLICLKMSKQRYYAALKQNHNNAVALGNRGRAQSEGQKSAQAEVNRIVPNEIAQKIKFFVPTDKEVDAAVEGKDPKEVKNG